MLPSLLSQLLGEVLDEPRPAGRVQHPADVRLLEQQQLGVARDPAREAGGHAGKAAGYGHIEREHQHGVGAADAGAERGERGAQHVHPGVALGHHRQRCDRVQTAAPPSGSPTTSATRAQSWRAARILAIVMNWSSSAASRKLICRNASPTVMPDSVSSRR